MNTLLLKEANNLRIAMEMWIGNEEEGSSIPKGMETLNRIQGHELQVNAKRTTMNMMISVHAYIGSKWLVDPDPFKYNRVALSSC